MISRKTWALRLMGIIVLLAVLAGGCGSSSDISSSVNSDLSGAWHFESGTVSFTQNGTSYPVEVMDFSMMYTSCDVDQDNGSAVVLAAAILQADQVIYPILVDHKAVTSTRTDYDAWRFTLGDSAGSYTAKLEDGKLVMSGTLNIQEGVSVTFDITSSKATSSQYARLSNPSETLNGTWSTNSAQDAPTGGGFLIGNNNFYAGRRGLAVLIFSDTDAAMTSTTVTGSGFMPTVDTNGRTGVSMPLSFFEQNVSVTHLFENYYKFGLSSVLGDMIGLFVFMSETNAVMVVQGEQASGIGEVHTLFVLDKATDTDNSRALMRSLIPSSWSLSGGGTAINPNETTNRAVPIEGSNMILKLESADENLNVTFSLSGDIVLLGTDTAAMTFDGTPVTLTFRHIGYNAYYAEGGENPTHHLRFSIIDDNMATFSDAVTAADGYYTSLIGRLDKQ